MICPGLKRPNGIAEVSGNYPSSGGHRGTGVYDSEGNLLAIGQPIMRGKQTCLFLQSNVSILLLVLCCYQVGIKEQDTEHQIVFFKSFITILSFVSRNNGANRPRMNRRNKIPKYIDQRSRIKVDEGRRCLSLFININNFHNHNNCGSK